MDRMDDVITKSVEPGRWLWLGESGWLPIAVSGAALLVLVQAKSGGVALARSPAEAEALLVELFQEGRFRLGDQFKVLGSRDDLAAVRRTGARLGFEIAVEREVPERRCQAFFSPSDGRLRFEKASLPSAPPAASPTPSAAPPAASSAPISAVSKTRILIVDDSKTIRKVLRSIFARDPEIEVVGECESAHGVEDAIIALKPDVLSLDLNMPEITGVDLVRGLLPRRPIPVVLVTALSIEQGDQVLQALAAGAVDYIQKPAFGEVDAAAADICQRFKAAGKAQVRVGTSKSTAPREAFCHLDRTASARKIILIGASTGGTEALSELLGALPANIPPILIVQHMPPVFSAAFAARLANHLPFAVCEAKDRDDVVPGKALLAPGGFHMRLARDGTRLVVRVESGQPVSGHQPSVDALFDSAAPLVGRDAIGVILTGMGKDGAQGLLKLRQAQARTLGQDEATSVVYGMPRVAKSLGAVECELPLHRIAPKIVELLAGSDSKRKAG